MTKLVDLDAVLAAAVRWLDDEGYQGAYVGLEDAIRALPAQPTQAGSEAVVTDAMIRAARKADHEESMEGDYDTSENQRWRFILEAALRAAPTAPRDPVAVVEGLLAKEKEAVKRSPLDNFNRGCLNALERAVAALHQSQEQPR